MRVIWSPLAMSRASEIARFISTDSPKNGIEWVNRLFDFTDDLGKFPNMGRIAPELKRENYRELIFESFRIVYRVEEKRILILTIRHVRQKLNDDETKGEASV